MDAIAFAHARGLARCLLERGMCNYELHSGYNRTFHSSDVSDSSSSSDDSSCPDSKRRRVDGPTGAQHTAT